MTSDRGQKTSLFTPTRLIAALGLCVVLLGGAMFVAWLAALRTVTLEITEPAGKTVVCHMVVDGRPESRRGVAPLTLRFEAKELRYAVVCLDASPSTDVTVTLYDSTRTGWIGTGSVETASGVTGFYTADWRRSRSHIEPMTPTHVATMRTSATAKSL
jgi:hypothetical protein